MTNSISVWSLIVDASLVVQCVMLLLLTLSFISWYMIWERLSGLSLMQSASDLFEDRFWSGIWRLAQLDTRCETPADSNGILRLFNPAGLSDSKI